MNGRRKVGVFLLVVTLTAWLILAYTAFGRSSKRVDVGKSNKFIIDHSNQHLNGPSNITRNEQVLHGMKKKTKRSRPKILLLTYMRSGSTFVGSMFGVNSDIFYVFEPLHFLHPTIIEDKTEMSNLNSTQFVEYVNKAQRYLNDIFSCRFQKINTENLKHDFWWYSTEGIQFMQCSKKKPKNDTLIGCRPILTKACSRRDVTAVKTIRLTMSMAERMIQTDQSLKVIHLVRDPRATLISRMALRYIPPRHWLDYYSRHHCRTVHEDVVLGRRLLATYPDNVKLVLYEDITMDTMRVVKEIYDFLKLPFTVEVEEHVKEVGSKEEDCFLCTSHSNKTHQLLKWRKSAKYTDVEIIDRNCKDLYKSVGYLPVESERHLRDFSRPLRIKLP